MKRHARQKRERGAPDDARVKISPMFVTGAVMLLVLLVLTGGSYIRHAFVARLDPRISIERGEVENRRRSAQGGNAQSGAIFDGEVYRTEQRLREASALVVATGLYGVRAIAEQHPVRDVNELLTGVVGRGLVPPGLALASQESAFSSERGTLYVRFRPQPFAVEILAVPRERLDGPCLLVRVPDIDAPLNAAQGGDTRVRYFQAMRLDGVRAPPPFARASEIQASGWTVETMRSAMPQDAEAERLTSWLREMNARR